MTEKIKSEVISRRRVFSLLGLAIASGLVATIPVSPQVTPRGVELSVDQAQAVTYRRARVTARRVDRRVTAIRVAPCGVVSINGARWARLDHSPAPAR